MPISNYVTHSQLVSDFTALGMRPGSVVMLHSSYKAVGNVLGGPPVVIDALLQTLTPQGTLMMYVGWENSPPDYFVNTPPDDVPDIIYREHPAYDPRTARAVRDHGVLAETFRTHPGVLRSAHPDSSFCALGQQAEYITRDHPFFYGYGENSPLEKLCQLNGYVLMLGAPLFTVTLLHYAEHKARLANKRIIRYRCPILLNGEKVWVDLEEFDTGINVIDAEYGFQDIAGDYLAAGGGVKGQVGQAETYLFDAAGIAAFGIRWLEERWG